MTSNSNDMPTTIEGAMQLQARFLIDAFSTDESPIDGTLLDFSKASLMLVDQVLRDFHVADVLLPDDLHLIASCYVFETIRQNLGGNYHRSDKPNDFVLILGDPEFQLVCLVMERVWACASHWEANRLILFYEAIEKAFEQKKSFEIGAIPL